MVERLAIVLGLAVLGFAAYCIVTRCQVALIARRKKESDVVLQRLQPGVPAIVYFTTPGCVPCVTQQQPALKEVESTLGTGIQIVKIDATEEPKAADSWGVMSAPTTFIVDRQGRTRAVNHGVAHSPKLHRQLEQAS